jgi:hypothetical protein
MGIENKSSQQHDRYYDRSAAAPPEELDAYGVWVKSEPQDLASLESGEDAADSSFDGEFSAGESLDAASAEALSGGIDESLNFDNLLEEPLAEAVESGFDDALSLEDDAGMAAMMENIIIEHTPSSGGEGPSASSMHTQEDAGVMDAPQDSPGETIPHETDDDREGFTEISMEDFLACELNESEDASDSDNPFTTEILRETGASAPANQSPDLSAQLLMRIVEELSSIKNELVELKKELALRRDGPEKALAGDAGGGGFFDEDNDEKIALTGDELDNILQNADFTEEAGTDESLSDDDGIEFSDGAFSIDVEPDEFSESAPPEGSAGFDIPIGDAPEEGEALGKFDAFPLETAEDGALDTPAADGAVEFDALSLDDGSAGASLEADGSSDLQTLLEEGVQPMSEAPEDTGYIDTDPLKDEPEYALDMEEPSLDFSNAVIEEPDLSRELKENPISEPSIDDIALDLEFNAPLAPESAAEAPDLEVSFGEAAADQGGEEGMDIAGADETPAPVEGAAAPSLGLQAIPPNIRKELCAILSYMDQLLESLPEEKIEEFARSEYFDTYKKLFEELGLS